jgi:hypothetical protein
LPQRGTPASIVDKMTKALQQVRRNPLPSRSWRTSTTSKPAARKTSPTACASFAGLASFWTFW